MTCPNCKGELSRVWQPQRSSNVISIAQVQWSCSTCGGSFSSKDLRPGPKRSAKVTPLQPETV
jgi:hypothetical protein